MMVKGRVTYRIYCTSCHGPTGRGDGNLAQYMNVPPANLTQLAANAEGGVFPTDQLHDIIDGRKPGVRGHGAKEMPVWGDVFKALDTVADDEEMVSQKISELVVFLESIQEDGAGG
jgi:mono/diheme cytochrome c family protein